MLVALFQSLSEHYSFFQCVPVPYPAGNLCGAHGTVDQPFAGPGFYPTFEQPADWSDRSSRWASDTL